MEPFRSTEIDWAKTHPEKINEQRQTKSDDRKINHQVLFIEGL